MAVGHQGGILHGWLVFQQEFLLPRGHMLRMGTMGLESTLWFPNACLLGSTVCNVELVTGDYICTILGWLGNS